MITIDGEHVQYDIHLSLTFYAIYCNILMCIFVFSFSNNILLVLVKFTLNIKFS